VTIPDTVQGLARHEQDALEHAAETIKSLCLMRERAKGKWNDEHARIVYLGGGNYVPGMLGDLVLFNSRATGSTLALPESQLTPEAVRAHIAESNAKFGVRS
jgi:hypothetical protein